MSITIIPTPIQTVIVSNTVETKNTDQTESLGGILTEAKINNEYNKIKTDENLNENDIGG